MAQPYNPFFYLRRKHNDKLRFLFLLFAIFLFSCDKEENPDPDIPDWLNVKIQQLESSAQDCRYCQITRYTFNNEYYYDYHCGYSSCAFCNMYNSIGQRVEEAEDFNFVNFLESYSDAEVVWSCPR